MKFSKIVVLISFMLCNVVLGSDSAPSGVVPPENILRLVFFGKTGVGKSTTVNACYNFTKGTTWDAFPKLFPIKTRHQECNVPEYFGRNTEDHSKGDLGAVTKSPSEYVASTRNLVVNLVDCPGVADPDGIERDVEITHVIADFLNRVGEFNAICIVVPTTINRATIEEIYLIEQLKTIIPKSSQNRIFLVVSFATRIPQNVKDFASHVGLPVDNIFAFDHFALSREGHVKDGDEEVKMEVALKWGASKKSFDNLIAKAKSLGKYKTAPMARISEIRAMTSEKISEGLRQIEAIETLQTQNRAAQAAYQLALETYNHAVTGAGEAERALALAQAEREAANAIAAYVNYDEREAYLTSTLNTVCNTCAEVCHESCRLKNFGRHCYEHITGCWCMTDGYCTQCTNKCSYTAHRHRYEEYKTVSKKREKPGVKARQASAAANVAEMSSNSARKQQTLDESADEKERRKNLMDELEGCLTDLMRERAKLQNRIVELYVELDAVSMGSINFHIGEYYTQLIAKTNDPAKKSKFEKDRAFYIEQVELYKRKTGKA